VQGPKRPCQATQRLSKAAQLKYRRDGAARPLRFNSSSNSQPQSTCHSDCAYVGVRFCGSRRVLSRDSHLLAGPAPPFPKSFPIDVPPHRPPPCPAQRCGPRRSASSPLRAAVVCLFHARLACCLTCSNRDVLRLYRDFLREARKRPDRFAAVVAFVHGFFFREVLSSMVRRQFRSRASWPWRDVEAVEGWLARGRAQLQQLRTAPFDGVSVYRPRDPPGPPPAS
jgi:hypothetical protein